MNCSKFQDSITDYLDSGLDSRSRAEFATHRLRCRSCRELFNDVREAVGVLGSLAKREVESPEGLELRILEATTAGEMLSCSAFDSLIERYFDGVILAPTFQTFQSHFSSCSKCRRLLSSIQDAIDLCREVKEAEVEVPHSLYDRIVAATSGAEADPSDGKAWFRRWRAAVENFVRPFWTPQWAAAALIFAASGLIIISRFGSVSAMASEGRAQAERLVNQGQEAINQTGVIAITGIQRVSDGFTSIIQETKSPKSKAAPPQSTPQPSPEQKVEPAKPKPSRGADEPPEPEQPNKPQGARRSAGGGLA